MHDDTRVPPLPTSGEAPRGGIIISEGIIGRRKQKITGLRLVLFGAVRAGGRTQRAAIQRGKREREREDCVGMRRGHVIVLGMIPNKDFTAAVCRNLNNKIPTMAPTLTLRSVLLPVTGRRLRTHAAKKV